MEEGLLKKREGSGRHSGHHRDHVPEFRRKSDAIASGSAFQKAAALDEDGIGLPEQILDQTNYETSAKLYFVFIRFDYLWSLNYFALLVFNFLEKPLWCLGYTEYSCSNGEYYYLGKLPFLTRAETIVYEVVTLVILSMHCLFPISYEGLSIYYWKRPLNKLRVILLLVLVLDLLLYIIFLSPV